MTYQTAHLMALELGPVVQIVAAARKTRDLWFGSFLLSEIAKAVAKAVGTACRNGDASGHPRDIHEYLIAPAPTSASDLEFNSAFVMGDEILVEVPPGVDPIVVARTAREAAHQSWLAFAEEAKDPKQPENQRFRVPAKFIDQGEWTAQTSQSLVDNTCGEIVEVYAAWVPLPPNLSGNAYQDCLTRVKWLLEGRTACRNFPAANGQDEGHPKSSLDGRRRTVLTKPADPKKPHRHKRLRLNRGEQLDALGFTKRVWGGRKNYPSTARLAADPWIRGVKNVSAAKLNSLVAEAKNLAHPQSSQDDPILGEISVRPSDNPRYPQFEAFAYDGAILYPNRHHEFLEEAEEDRNSPKLVRFKELLKSIQKDHGEPGTYYAILMADGDNVGAALGQCADPKSHREFSASLSAFAGSVHAIVEKHQGALVYAAGEDIVALLPLDHCVDCADDLRQKFRDDLAKLSAHGKPMTLSVGIAIGHFLDALEDVHQAARDMLDERAKGFDGKNALAIQYRPRGGAPIESVHGWDSDPLARINEFAGLLKSGGLPSKIAYDVRHLAKGYKHWFENTSEAIDLRNRAMTADLVRLLSSKKAEARTVIDAALAGIDSPADVINLANTIIVARLIAESRGLSDGRRR